MKQSILGVAMLVAVFPVLASAQSQALPPPVPPDLAAVTENATEEKVGNVDATVPPTYVVGPDDEILIQVLSVPDISAKPQRVDPNGDIRLPMVGRVHAAGLTLEALENELTERLKVYLENPDVSITVTDFHSQPVSVLGAVGTSGVQQLSGSKTLLEVLSMAGGLAPDAGPMLRITRRKEWGQIPLPDTIEDARFSTAEVDIRALLDAKTPEKNIVVRPHDVISVQRAAVVFVVGEVGRPGPIPLSGSTTISVLEAVSLSGGPLRLSNPAKAWIARRVTGNQRFAEENVDLKKITQGQAKDPMLLAGDILVIPDNTGKRVTIKVLESMLWVATSAATYGLYR